MDKYKIFIASNLKNDIIGKKVYCITSKLKIIITCNFRKKVTGMPDYLNADKFIIIFDCNLKKEIIDKLVYHITGKLKIKLNRNFEKKITGNQVYLLYFE